MKSQRRNKDKLKRKIKRLKKSSNLESKGGESIGKEKANNGKEKRGRTMRIATEPNCISFMVGEQSGCGCLQKEL